MNRISPAPEAREPRQSPRVPENSTAALDIPAGTARSCHVLVLPGGGYVGHADNEAEPVVEWLALLGLSASVFRYPVRVRHPGPLDAARAEVRRIKADGAEKVVLLGFSAGGHLAGQLALTASPSDPERVDAAMLCYPVVSMELDTHRGTQLELLGSEPGPAARAATSLDRLVTASAPPFFLWHTANDPSVPVQHSYLLAQALARQNVSHALHVFPEGTHGLGLARGAGEAEFWTALGASWLGRFLRSWGSGGESG